MKLAVVFWRSEQGNEPVREWLRKMDAETRKAIGDDVRYIQEKWTEGVGKRYVDGFGDGLYEVRTKQHNKEYRVLFCMEDDAMVLLHGLIKKTKKTPPADVALARRRQKE
jgi:phage-related protein